MSGGGGTHSPPLVGVATGRGREGAPEGDRAKRLGERGLPFLRGKAPGVSLTQARRGPDGARGRLGRAVGPKERAFFPFQAPLGGQACGEWRSVTAGRGACSLGAPPALPGSRAWLWGTPGRPGFESWWRRPGPDGEELQSRTPVVAAVSPLGHGGKELSLCPFAGRETEAQREPWSAPCWVALLFPPSHNAQRLAITSCDVPPPCHGGVGVLRRWKRARAPAQGSGPQKGTGLTKQSQGCGGGHPVGCCGVGTEAGVTSGETEAQRRRHLPEAMQVGSVSAQTPQPGPFPGPGGDSQQAGSARTSVGHLPRRSCSMGGPSMGPAVSPSERARHPSKGTGRESVPQREGPLNNEISTGHCEVEGQVWGGARGQGQQEPDSAEGAGKEVVGVEGQR